MDSKKTKIFIAGHRGMVGSAILRKYENEGYDNLITRSRDELDLTKQKDVDDFFQTENRNKNVSKRKQNLTN